MIFLNQEKLRINISLGEDLTDVTSVVYIATRPRLGKVSFAATISDVAIGATYYDILEGDLNDEGVWCIYPEVTYTDGRKVQGTSEKFKVNYQCQ